MSQSKLNNGGIGRDTDTFTHEERVTNGAKGGVISGQSRRARKQMRETLNYLLNVPLKKGKKKTEAEKLKSIEAASGVNLDAQTMMMLSILKKAIKGDVVAATFIRDTLGENPFVVAEKEKEAAIAFNENEEQKQIDVAANILTRIKESTKNEEGDS